MQSHQLEIAPLPKIQADLFSNDPTFSFHLVHFNTHSALDILNFMGI